MGKFLRKRRRPDVAVLEGCSGVRTSSASSRPGRNGACKSVSSMKAESRDPRAEQPDQENSQPPQQQDHQLGANPRCSSSSVQESLPPDQDHHEEPELEEEVDENRPGKRSNSSSHQLRESHSDSCLKNRNVAAAPAIGVAHSRSNSATFSHNQALIDVVALDHHHLRENVRLAAAAVDLHRSSMAETSNLDATRIMTKDQIEASCCGDNTIVLFASKESQRLIQASAVPAMSPAPDPASANEKKLQQQQQPSSGSRLITRSNSRPRPAADCGPGWRHRVAASAPTCDEIEEFFARVEAKDDSSSKRFVDKYNFDVFNDVPLSGRFEWVHFHSGCS